MAVLFTSPYFQAFDDNGNPLSGGKVYTYAAGTSTPKPTFTTAEATQEHENPIILDAAGRAVIFIQGSYDYVITDALDNIIETVSNVTSFTALESAGDSFFQSFTGNGTQTVFPLSEPLGTDSNAVMVFIEEVPIQNIKNGDFSADEDWTKGAGWTISSGVATATGDISTALTQTASVAIVENQAYVVQYTVTRSAGGVTPSVGGRAGVERTANGTYTEIIVAGSTQDIAFTGNAFTGTLEDVKVSLVAFNGDTFLNPNQYSLSGTSITFVNAPANGAIIKITAPSLLIGAASAAAEIAENAETGALAAQSAAEQAQAAAEEAATKLVGTSDTSLLIEVASKVFTTQEDKFFEAGNWLLITSDADPTNYMHGQVTDYSGTSLTVNVTNIGGSGTFDDWTIRLSGTRGTQGLPGTIGDLSGVPIGTIDPAADFVVFQDVNDNNTTKRSLLGTAAVEDVETVREIPSNSKSEDYTLVLSDAGKHILHPSADTTARTWTIPANSSVAFPIGTAVTFVNQDSAGVVTIAITTDTMRLAGAGTTGSRTLAANGVATALKITATEWIISGTGLS